MTVLSKRTLCLLRAVIPTWKFFEEFTCIPKLEYRNRVEGKDFGNWQACLSKAKRGIGSFILNPQGNLLLACHDLVNQLVADLEDADELKTEKFAESVSYRLVQRMVEKECGPSSEFQFRVLTLSTDLKSEVVLLSEVHKTL